MGKAQKILTWFEDIVSILFFIVGMGLMLYEVIMRYVFSHPTTWINEISTSLIIWGVFLGFSLALRDDHHVSADIIYAILPPKARKAMDYFANLVGIVFCIFFVYYSTLLFNNLLHSRQVSIETGIPMWVFMVVLPVSGVMFGIRFIERLWRVHKTNYYKEDADRKDYNNDTVDAEAK